MKTINKSSFLRDISGIRNKRLLEALKIKIAQIRKAKQAESVIGVKKLRGYSTQYRIKIVSGRHSYRIGAIIHGNTIWLI